MPITTTIADRIAEIVFDVPPVNAFDSVTWISLPAMITAAASQPGRQLRPDPRRWPRLLRRCRYQGNAGASRAHHRAQPRQLPDLQGDPRRRSAGGRRRPQVRHRRRHRHLRRVGQHHRRRRRLFLAARGRSRRDGRCQPFVAHAAAAQGARGVLHRRQHPGGRSLSARRGRESRAARRSRNRSARLLRHHRLANRARRSSSPRKRSTGSSRAMSIAAIAGNRVSRSKCTCTKTARRRATPLSKPARRRNSDAIAIHSRAA